MKEKKYIVIVKGVLKFENKKKVQSGGFVPSDVSKDEIKDKIQRGLIAEFDEKLTANVQASKNEEINLVKELEAKIKNLETENGLLKKENEDLKNEIEDLLSEDPEDPKKKGGKK